MYSECATVVSESVRCLETATYRHNYVSDGAVGDHARQAAKKGTRNIGPRLVLDSDPLPRGASKKIMRLAHSLIFAY